MSILKFMISFWVTLFCYFFIYSQILYPLIYSLPKSIAAIKRKEVRPAIILSCLLAPIIWIVLLTGVYTILINTSPAIGNFLLTDIGFMWGQIVAFVIVLIQPLRKKGREDLRHDYYSGNFYRFMSPYFKNQYEQFLEMLPNVDDEELINVAQKEDLHYVYKRDVYNEIDRRKKMIFNAIINEQSQENQ